MLDLPRCPECGGALPVKEFLRAACTRGQSMKTIPSDAGLLCPTRGARLLPVRRRFIVQVAALVTCAAAAGLAAFWSGRSLPGVVAQTGLVMGTIVAMAMLESRLVRFAEAPDATIRQFPFDTARQPARAISSTPGRAGP